MMYPSFVLNLSSGFNTDYQSSETLKTLVMLCYATKTNTAYSWSVYLHVAFLKPRYL